MNLRIGLFFFAIAAAAPSLANVPLRPGCDELALSRLKNAKQIVTVFSENWDSSEATVRTWERSDSGWKPVFAPEPAMIGRAGMAWGYEFSVHSKGGSPKKEGDGRSPAGVFPMGSEFGFDAPKGEDKFLALKPTTHCVDDVSSKHYNKIVDEKVGVDWKSSEKMRSIEVYKYGIEVAYPSSAEDKAGSCIFFHIWNGPGKPTAGCTSVPEASMKKLIAWMKPETAVAVFLPENEVPAWSHCLP